VDFDLSDDERALAEGMRRLCEGRFPMERVRAGEGRRMIDPADWKALADAGVFSLRVPEPEGGAAMGTGAAAVVYEELGRALVPGPLVASHVAAGVVKGADTGEHPVGLLHRPPPDRRLALVVPDLGSLGTLLVVDAATVQALDPSTVHAEPIEHGLDPLTPLWRVRELPEGTVVGDADLARRLWRDHLVLSAALLVGMAAATADMAVAYAKVRKQFGRPIGAFQAVKHLCADMLVRTETARAAVHAAAVTADQPDVGDATRAAGGAALLAAEAAVANAKTCIQVHGGMGFTWEVPAHLYLMRARVLSQQLGPAGRLAQLVAERF
jgi:alkylation response protein AidB-like acyl-CoA dehydrogenase